MKALFNPIANACATLLVMICFATGAAAQEFEFNVEGDGEIEWNFEFTETEEFTTTTGADFAFNGGAGTDGNAFAEGDIAATVGLGGQEAGGSGFAVGDVYGAYAAAEFSSAAYMATGALAADFAFDDLSEIEVGGLVNAGGAGYVDLGLSTGTEYEYTNTGSGYFDLEADLEAEIEN